MGLCKCPQRKVTNIFCYEHRVNVCEHCLMHNHPKCVVDTYRNWITDSVFSSKCGLCEEELLHGETIRLLCFHIVHWACLDSWARELPANTAPAGYHCPICKKMCLFPQRNQVSPIADELRLKMGQVNWARLGLGLPLLEKETSGLKEGQMNGIYDGRNFNGPSEGMSDIPDPTFEPAAKFNQSYEDSSLVSKLAPYVNHSSDSYVNSTHTEYGTNQSGNNYYSSPSTTSATYIPSTRKPFRSDFEMESPVLMDEDEHKYRRRSPFESLSRWIKNSATVKSKRGRKRTAVYVILGILLTFLIVMFLFGRSESSDEYAFNPEGNPRVMIGDGVGIKAQDHINFNAV